MSTNSIQSSRANIELILFGFVVSLTLKAGMDTAYNTIHASKAILADSNEELVIPYRTVRDDEKFRAM